MNITVFLVYLCFLVYCLIEIGGSINSTTCYGSHGLRCSAHTLSCTSPLVIHIINTSYGYRAGCNDIVGKSNCLDVKCCKEETFDCVILFSHNHSMQVHNDCNGRKLCEIKGRRRLDVLCGSHSTSAYSKIQYECVANDFFPTLYTDRPNVLQPDIETSYDSIIIIVGVISAIMVLVIMLLVTVCIYKIRHKQSIKSREDNHVVLSTREHYATHCASIDDASVVDRNYIGEYEEVKLDDQCSTSALVDNVDQNEYNSNVMTRSSTTEKYTSDTATNYYHILSNNTNNFQIANRNNYDHINDVQYPVGVDDYNHIGEQDRQEMASDDNYNHISI